MEFYLKKRKDWKKEWKIYKKSKKQANQDFIPFVEWENQHLEELAKSSSEQFKTYCEGYKKAQKLKLRVGLAVSVGVLACCAGVLLSMGVYYGAMSVEVKSATAMLLGAVVGTRIATLVANTKARAFKFVNRVWHGKNFKCYKLSTNLFKKRDKENNQKRIEVKQLTREEFQREPMFLRRLRRARLPKIMQKYFKTGEISVAEPKVEATPVEVKPTKEEIKKEWYSQNLLTADKLNVTLYGNTASMRSDCYTRLGDFEVDSIDKVFDKDKIGLVLGEVGVEAVSNLNDELLVGVRAPDTDIRSDSSFTTINKNDYELKTEIQEHEDVPEATL